MTERNNFVKDLNGLILGYLSREQCESYLLTMTQTFYPNSSEIDSSSELFTKIFNDSLVSERIRFLTDTLVTFASKELTSEKYLELLLDLKSVAKTCKDSDYFANVKMIIIFIGIFIFIKIMYE